MRTNRQGAAAPQVLAAQFMGLLAAQDIDGIMGLYADDAVVSLADGREAAGRAAIRRAFERAFAGALDLGAGAATQSRVVVAGALAMTSFTGADGAVRTLVARRVPDGTWLWVRDGSTLRQLSAVPEVDLLAMEGLAGIGASGRVDMAVPA
jgi:ketosteroid isomerase-like protein